MKRLLIVAHEIGGRLQEMREAVERGARLETDIDLRVKSAFGAGPEDLLWCDGVIFGTPENFGYMSGALKDFFERTYYETREQLSNPAYALFVCGGSDGTGAVRSVERILKGYPMKKVSAEIICLGPVSEEVLARCEELGQGVAAGLSLGIF